MAEQVNGEARGPSKPLNTVFTSFATTIFEVMSKLAVQHGAVNLGQGFPDDEGPQSMKKVAADALFEHHNQYPPMAGVPELRKAVAAHSKAQHGLDVDWETEAVVTVGATEAIAACFMGLTNPGDEVVVFDPMYDSYVAMAQQCGVTLVPVALELPSLAMPRDALAAAFSPKTKFVLLNTPHNPTGKVFSPEELSFLAELCVRHDTLAVCDEVYEHLVFPNSGARHVSLRTLPGMRDRTLRIGSAGKTFSFTAWKVGWLTGPARLVSPVCKAHSFLTFTVASNLQRAVAFGLENEPDFFGALGSQLAAKRQFLVRELEALGLRTLPADGTYFLLADVSPLLKPGEDDAALCMRLTREAHVTLIPVSPFYVGADPPKHLVRFAFCKTDAKLQAACANLRAYLEQH